MRFAKFSRELTSAAEFKDPKSRIGIRFDGSLRFDLAGEDKSDLRAAVFLRDGYKCINRLAEDAPVPADSMEFWLSQACLCDGPLELSHWPPMSKSGGSDHESTCFTRCRKHHRLLDNNQVGGRKSFQTEST